MVLNTNIPAQMAVGNLSSSNILLSKSLSRLSSGSKIVNAADDAAGLAVSSRLDAQLKRLDAASSNVGNTISFIQTQDGFLKKAQQALDRMSELAVLAQDVTKQPQDLLLYDKEFQTLCGYITDMSTKKFNDVSLFSPEALTVTTDSDPTIANSYVMAGIDLTATGGAYDLAIQSNVTTVTDAQTALDNVRTAIDQLATDRATIGSHLARMGYTLEQLQVYKENLMAANSRIKDVDVADESTKYARYQILVQSGTAMLAQANTLPQNILRLLQQ